jgi:hypothetical protein
LNSGHVACDQDTTIIAVVEMSQSSGLVGVCLSRPAGPHVAIAPLQDGDAQPDDEPLRVGRE